VSKANFFEQVGGEETFRRLVGTFYEGVELDPILRPMYPDADLTAAQERLFLFLQQYWGGPSTYSETRGHPRLRLRHAPFKIGGVQRDAWLSHMRVAVDSLKLAPDLENELWNYLVAAANSLVNADDQV
jgi:hemoglobin